MKLIPLTQSKFAMVDDADYEWLMQWKWCAIWDGWNWYAVRYVGPKKNRKRIPMHRMIVKAKKNQKVDHGDNNGLNDQRYNLRICSNKENARNRRPQRHKSSKYKGVYWNKQTRKWHVQIMIDQKNIYLGLYTNERIAALAYDVKAQEIFGEFAYLNFPKKDATDGTTRENI
jgi:hypothetical protein